MGKVIKMKDKDSNVLYPITVSNAISIENTNVYERVRDIESAISEMFKLIEEGKSGDSGNTSSSTAYFDFTNFENTYKDVYRYRVGTEFNGTLTSAHTLSYSGPLTGTTLNNPSDNLVYPTYNNTLNNPYSIVSYVTSSISAGTNWIREIVFVQIKDISMTTDYYDEGSLVTFNPYFCNNSLKSQTYKNYPEILASGSTKTIPYFMWRLGGGNTYTVKKLVEIPKNGEYHKMVLYRDINEIGYTVDGTNFEKISNAMAVNYDSLKHLNATCGFNIKLRNRSVIANSTDLHIDVFAYKGIDIKQFIHSCNFFS